MEKPSCIPENEDKTNLLKGIKIPAPTEEEVDRAYRAIVTREPHSTFESYGQESQPISSDPTGQTHIFFMEAIRPQKKGE